MLRENQNSIISNVKIARWYSAHAQTRAIQTSNLFIT